MEYMRYGLTIDDPVEFGICKNGWMDWGPVCAGDSWGRRHTIATRGSALAHICYGNAPSTSVASSDY